MNTVIKMSKESMNRTQKSKKLLSPKAGALSVLSYSPKTHPATH